MLSQELMCPFRVFQWRIRPSDRFERKKGWCPSGRSTTLHYPIWKKVQHLLKAPSSLVLQCALLGFSEGVRSLLLCSILFVQDKVRPFVGLAGSVRLPCF